MLGQTNSLWWSGLTPRTPHKHAYGREEQQKFTGHTWRGVSKRATLRNVSQLLAESTRAEAPSVRLDRLIEDLAKPHRVSKSAQTLSLPLTCYCERKRIKCVTGYKGIPYGVYILSRFGELLHQLATRLHARSSDSNKNCYAAITLKVLLCGIDLQGIVPLALLLMPVTRLTVILFKEFITSKQRVKRYVWDVTVHSTLHHPLVGFKRKCDKFPKSLVELLIGRRPGGTNTIRFAVWQPACSD